MQVPANALLTPLEELTFRSLVINYALDMAQVSSCIIIWGDIETEVTYQPIDSYCILDKKKLDLKGEEHVQRR